MQFSWIERFWTNREEDPGRDERWGHCEQEVTPVWMVLVPYIGYYLVGSEYDGCWFILVTCRGALYQPAYFHKLVVIKVKYSYNQYVVFTSMS